MAERETTGRCLCGAIGFTAIGDPLTVALCHCESCRRQSGSVAVPFATFRKDGVRWRGIERSQYRSTPPVLRSFCPTCGSALAYEHDGSPGEIDLFMGAMDEPGRLSIRMQVHYGERVAWFDTADHKPRYRTSSSTGEPPMATQPAAVD
ncbi:MAG: GFA family protein [Geminicoccaceae bacterium]